MVGGVGAAAGLLGLNQRRFARVPASFGAAIGGRTSWELVRRDVFRHYLPAIAPHIERAFGAAKLDLTRLGGGGGPIGVELGVGDERVARVMPERFHRVGHLAVVLDGELAAHGGDGERGILPEGPVNQIEVMDAVVGELAAAVVEEPAELVEPAVPVIGHLRRRSYPGFPIKSRGRCAVGRIANPLRPLVLNMERAYAGDLAQPAAAHKFRHLAAHGRRAAMQASLTHPPVPLHRLDHRAPEIS